jgi:hypothetical protein
MRSRVLRPRIWVEPDEHGSGLWVKCSACRDVYGGNRVDLIYGQRAARKAARRHRREHDRAAARIWEVR